MPELQPNLLLLSPIEIASWQLPAIKPGPTRCAARLPALQRGAVWKPRQVELLWDSLLRGFPIGSFLLAPFREERAAVRFLHEQGPQERVPAYHLLDGQQRCNAVALGFLDVWKPGVDATAALWIDLGAAGAGDGRVFVFRVVTRSHPWGYQRRDPAKTLEQRHRRSAHLTFQEVARQAGCLDESGNPRWRDLRHSWPWDAECPVPLAFLVDAVRRRERDPWRAVLDAMAARLPCWPLLRRADPGVASEWVTWPESLAELVRAPTAAMDRLLHGLTTAVGAGTVGSVRIPALVIDDLAEAAPAEDVPASDDAEDRAPHDAVETLFIRVNSAGTPLQGEELSYSILKSIWPEAHALVEGLATGIMAPARLVALLSRVVLANALWGAERPPAAIEVARFRRLIHGRDEACPDFLKRMKGYLSPGKGRGLFDDARTLLSLDPDRAVDFCLPPVLTTDIARSSPEVFFVLLLWLDRLRQKRRAGVTTITRDRDLHRRALGAVTALAWFAQDQRRASALLWTRLHELGVRSEHLLMSKGSLSACVAHRPGQDLVMPPLLPPAKLDASVQAALWGLGGGKNKTWSTWRWEQHFSGVLPRHSASKRWYEKRVRGEEEAADFQLHAWTLFVDTLWEARQLVLYAQREWMNRWFAAYDPSLPDQLEDTDRPWDIDHIHPQKFIERRHGIPQVVRDWHGSIGNLRAWPFELNRADAADEPASKLVDPGDPDMRFFPTGGRARASVVRQASFITRDWPDWKASTPTGSYPERYLAVPKYGACRVALVRAISSRWVALYKEWYDTLLVKDLG